MSDDVHNGSVRAASMALLAVAWLVPGAGHLLLHKRVRAVVFAGIVVASFATGLALRGELAVPRSADPFSWLAAAACLGNGALYGLARLIGLGAGNPQAASFAYGNTFLYTAGLMNLLLVLDVSDIARGDKD